MASRHQGAILRHLNRLVNKEKTRQASDRDLLDLFVRHGDEASFATIMNRHGPMVLNVCRRTLDNLPDAEDVFQATFLVLFKKAGKLRWQSSIASWLHQVAYRLARQARREGLRRKKAEYQIPLENPGNSADDLTIREAHAILNEELYRLPERLRAPLVLCYLESTTQDEAARQLCWSLRTLKRRLEQGKALLHVRLLRRGLGLATVLATGLLVPANLSAALVRTTLAAASKSPGTTAALLSPSVAALVRQGLRFFFLDKLKGMVTLVILLGLLGTGLIFAGLEPFPAPDKQAETPYKLAVPPQQGDPDVKPKQKFDLHGDPLPPGAMARLGTIRFRTGGFEPFFLPDGRTLMTASRQALQFWEITTGRLVREIPTGRLHVHRIALLSDGKLGAVSGTVSDQSADRPEIHVLNLATGKIARTFSGKDNPEPRAISPDGKLLVSIDKDLLRINEIATGKELRRHAFTKDCQLKFSPDGERLVVAPSNGKDNRKLFVWNWKRGDQRQLKVAGERINIFVLCVSPDNKVLAGGPHFDGTAIHLWSMDTGKLLNTIDIKGEKICASDLAFSPDGKVLAVADSGNRKDMTGGVYLWDLDRSRYLHKLLTPGEQVLRTSFSKDGRWLAATTTAGVRIWDPRTGAKVGDVEEAHRGHFKQILVSPFGFVVTGSWDYTVRIWDPISGRQKMKLDHGQGVHVMALSPDGTQLVTATDMDNTIRLWDLRHGRELKRLPPKPRITTGRALCFTPDGQGVVSWADDHSLQIWDLKTGRVVEHSVPRGPKLTDQHQRDVRREWEYSEMGFPSFSPDARFFLLPVGGKVKIYETAGGRVWDTIPAGRWTLAFSSDSRSFMGIEAEFPGPFAWVCELVSGKERRSLSFPGKFAGSIALSGNGRFAAVGIREPAAEIAVFDLITGKRLANFAGFRGKPTSLAFAPDNTFLVSGLDDTSALVWPLHLPKTPRNKKLDADTLRCLWDELAGGDAGKAFEAIWTLAQSPQSAIPFLRANLKPTRAPDPDTVARLLKDLKSDRFPIRQKAMQELEKLGDLVEPNLKAALAGNPSLETGRRIDKLLINLHGRISLPAKLREVRAVEALELMKTPEAIKLLDHLATGAPAARLTREAKETRERLGRGD